MPDIPPKYDDIYGTPHPTPTGISWLSISILIYMMKLSKHILLTTIDKLCYVNPSTAKIKFYNHFAWFINLSKRYLWVGLEMRALYFTSLSQEQLLELSKLICLAVKSACCHTKLLYRIICKFPAFNLKETSVHTTNQHIHLQLQQQTRILKKWNLAIVFFLYPYIYIYIYIPENTDRWLSASLQ